MAERTYFYLKQGDTGRALLCILEDTRGLAQDLTGATVRFSMRLRGSATPKVSAQACTVVDALAGTVRYDWQAADLDIPGVYQAEFVATLASGKDITFPANQSPADYLLVVVQDDV